MSPLIWTRMIYASFSMLSRLLSTIFHILFECSFQFLYFSGFVKKIIIKLAELWKKLVNFLQYIEVNRRLQKSFCPKYDFFFFWWCSAIMFDSALLRFAQFCTISLQNWFLFARLFFWCSTYLALWDYVFNVQIFWKFHKTWPIFHL